MMPMIESTARICTMVTLTDALGTSGKEKRMNPYVPIFSRTLARITEPAVGASTCASGSQVWNGKHWHLDGEPDEERPEHPLLHAEGHIELHQVGDLEGVSAELLVILEVERQDAQQHQHRTGQCVQEEFDGGVELSRSA